MPLRRSGSAKVAAGHHEAVNDPTFVGEVIDDRTFSFVCGLDEGDDPLEDPRCWLKANPMLGITITEEYLRARVDLAKQIPSKLNEILRLNFCMWTDADQAWMSREIVEPAMQSFDKAQHHGKRVHLGLDLSQNRDITALGAVVETGSKEVLVEVEGKKTQVNKHTFDAWVETWTPGDTVKARELRDKLSGSAQQQYQQLSRAERSRVDTLVRQADTLGMTRSQQLAYNAALRTSGPVLDEIVQKLARAEAAAKRSGKELNAYGVSAAQQAAAMRGVPAQITDIAVSLQGGQNPLTVFLQQGGQLKDMFGGIRPAAAALASQLLSMINPLTAAAAATAALGVAWYQVGEAQRQAELALITTGNYAGTSAGQIAALARQMDNLGGVTRGKALAALTQVAASGRFTGEQFQLVAKSAAEMEGATGQSVDATIAKFQEIAKDPVEALLKLNEAEHFLKRAQLDRIVALQDEGKEQEAVSAAVRLYHDNLDDVAAKARERLSATTLWWQEVKKGTSEAFNELGRYIDLSDRLAAICFVLSTGCIGLDERNIESPRLPVHQRRRIYQYGVLPGSEWIDVLRVCLKCRCQQDVGVLHVQRR